MPFALPAIAALAGTLIGTAVFESVLVGALLATAFSIGATFATQALIGAPKPPALPGFDLELRERSVTSRNTAEDRQIVFGEALMSGPMAQFAASGASNEFLHVVVPLCQGRSESVGDARLNNETIGERDGAGLVTEGRFKDHARVQTRLGTLDQAAYPDLVSEVGEWTAEHRGRGVTDVYARLKWSSSVWPNSFSNITARVRGMLMYDPRDAGADIASSSAAAPAVFTTSTDHGLAPGDSVWIARHKGAAPRPAKDYQVNTTPTATTFTVLDLDATPLELTAGGSGGTATKMRWSDNWALAVRRWLTFREGWAPEVFDEQIDDATVVAAANIADEQVQLADDPRGFTADPAEDLLTLSTKATWKVGDGVQVSSSETLPAGLAAATTYYVIRVDADHIKLAATLEDALAGTAVDITDAGTGGHTATRKSQRRYTVNGAVKIGGRDPIGILDEIKAAGAGAVVWVAGQFKIYAGAATAATGTVDESDFASGKVVVVPTLPMQEIFNAARGTYVDPDQFDAVVDAVPYTNATFEAQDGKRVYRDFNLSFTNDPVAAQRLLKIQVERARQGIVLEGPAKPRLANTAVWDVENVSLDFYGFADKPFRVINWKERQDFGIDVVWREEAPEMWDWNLGEETVVDPAPNSSIPNPFSVANPTGLAVTTSTFTTETGTPLHRLRISWTAPADGFVTSGGQFEIQFKESSAAEWEPSFFVDGDLTAVTIQEPVPIGINYDVRIRSVNAIGVKATTWQTIFGYTIGAPGAGADAQVDDGFVDDIASVAVDMGSITAAPEVILDDGFIT